MNPLRRRLLQALGTAALAPSWVFAQDAFIEQARGGFRFLPGNNVFATGCLALPGFELVHARLQRWLPLAQAYATIERHLRAQSLPMQALCGMELRIPEQLTMAQFAAFNKPYVEQLQRWNVLVDGHNSVARTNVVPAYGTLREASVHAFSYAAPLAQGRGDFLLAGVADIDKGRIVAEGDSSIGGMRARLAFVSITLEEKLAALGVSWAQVSSVDLYAARAFESLMQPLLLPRLGAAAMHGVRWHYARPPLIGTEVELEARHVMREIVVPA